MPAKIKKGEKALHKIGRGVEEVTVCTMWPGGSVMILTNKGVYKNASMKNLSPLPKEENPSK